MARQILFTEKIEDDRGQSFAMHEQGLIGLGTSLSEIAARLGRKIGCREEVAAAALAQRTILRIEMTSSNRWVVPVRLTIVIGTIGIMLFVAIGDGLSTAAPIALLLVIYLVAVNSSRKQLSRTRAQLRMLPNVCAVCIYDLSGLTAENDGCIICPECGGAWKLTPGDDN